jgi:hypothetical protein
MYLNEKYIQELRAKEGPSFLDAKKKVLVIWTKDQEPIICISLLQLKRN